MTVRLIELHRLVLRPNLPAGLNPLRVMAIADRLRNGGFEVCPPIVVYRLDGGYWFVDDGRHRVLGSWIAGRRDIRSKVMRGPAPIL